MARRRRPFGFVRALLAVAVATALLALAADRALAWYFEQASESVIESEGARGARVTIHGFPFLTQLASGRIDRVTGHLDSGTFSGHPVGDVSVDARDVVPREPFVARTVRADGLLGLESLQGAVSAAVGTDVEVGRPPGGATAKGALALTVPVSGVELTATVVPTAVDRSTLGIDVRELSLGGAPVAVDDLPGPVAGALGDIRVPLDLPEGVALAGASAEPGGLRIELDAVDVALGELTATTVTRPGSATEGGRR